MIEMKKLIPFLALLFVALLVLNAFKKENAAQINAMPPTACDNLTGVEKLVCLADAFKATLSSSQITTLQIDRTLANAKKWSNLPVGFSGRPGLRFKDLTTTQLAAAKALIQAALGTGSNEGYNEQLGLWAADKYLLQNGGGSGYGDDLYYIAFLGVPSMATSWELMTGGHHIAIANNYAAGQISGATPSFRGIEPFASFTIDGVSYQPLLQERDALAAMLSSLSSTELAAAKLSSTFGDLVLGPNKDWVFPTVKAGIKVGTLSATQKALVWAAINTYVSDIADADAATIMALYTAGLDDTYIAYSGNANLLNQNDYVRIDGPRVWIEYSTQNGIVLSPKHPHSVWRDRVSDYGGLGNPNVGTGSIQKFEGKFEVTPNPSSSNAQVSIELENASTINLGVFDMSGKKVLSSIKLNMTAGSHNLPLDEVQHLAKGLYNCVLEVKNAAGVVSVASKQLVKI
jgi:Protein of unknown function (DUF3500)